MTPDKARRLRSLTTQLAETLMTAAICAQEIRSVVCSELDEDADVCAGASWALAPALPRRQHRPLVDESTLSVIWKGKNVYLGNTRELQLLMSLSRRPNQFVTHLDLLREVWENEDVATATLRSVVRHLRRRLRCGGMRELADVFRKNKPMRWGGTWCTNSKLSLGIIRKKLSAGDLVLAYQTNEKSIIGVCRITQLVDRGEERDIWLEAVHRFPIAVPIHELKQRFPELNQVEAFRGGFPATIYPVNSRERQVLEQVLGVSLTATVSSPIVERRKSAGAGFGDAQTNKKVEAAAVQAVSRRYKRDGWKVTTVEAEKRGYDLVCKSGRKEEHVEVKGVTGEAPEFIITENEKRQLALNDRFILYVVTRALAKVPTLTRLVGCDVESTYQLVPIQYRAKRKR